MTARIERPHGTRDKYSAEKCRCTLCRAAFQAYKDHRAALMAAGGWRPYMEAEPVRQHVRALMAAGLSDVAVAALSGVPRSTISGLLYGCRGRGRRPSRRISVDIGERLLAVQPRLEDYPLRAAVDATGTQRRLQALAVLGWSSQALAPLLGLEPAGVARLMHRDRVRVSTALTVRRVYADLWDQLPSAATRAQRISVTKTRRMAVVRGWAPAMAWDDADLDDPAARPRGVRRGEAA